ncbi:MAG: ATP-binding protein [Propionibacteriaceae bacterium]|jgi:DNA transposition AAA+ family ATPase|nr:ATP-binding protein [Propionibacteriaceae bacterium]
MDPVTNPYSPGAGRLPMALVGRETQLKAWHTALKRVEAGRDAQSLVLYGLRGVGKTVLLSRFARIAEDAHWLVARIEAKSGSSMRDMVGEAFHGPLVDLARPGVGQRVLKALKTALSFKASYDTSGVWNFGVDLRDVAGGGADTGVFESDLSKLLRDLSEAAADQGTGVALLIDEAQDLPAKELIALCAIVHAANQRQDRLVVALAGLPSLPRRLSEAKSYAERLFSYHGIGALQPDDARRALVDPASDEDVVWSGGALDKVMAEAGGYPYFLQQYGQDTWNVAAESPLSPADAELGIAHGRAALDTGFFRVRWDRATMAEKNYLRAMAIDDDEGSQAGNIAVRLGKTVKSLGPIRASLIGKGLIYSPVHGVVAYTVPAMATFVRQQDD